MTPKSHPMSQARLIQVVKELGVVQVRDQALLRRHPLGTPYQRLLIFCCDLRASHAATLVLLMHMVPLVVALMNARSDPIWSIPTGIALPAP